MPSLKEIKGRIGSVRSTLKITSAMKLVSSAKLRKAQQAIGSMLPYEKALQEMLSTLMAIGGGGASAFDATQEGVRSVAIVALASNSSLCGGFNANAVRTVLDAVREYEAAGVKAVVYPIGRKMVDAIRKTGIPSIQVAGVDPVAVSAAPDYASASAVASSLMQDYLDGKYDRIELIYNHFVSTASQSPRRECWLPLEIHSAASQPRYDREGASVIPSPDGASESPDYIVEPSAPELMEELLPKTLRLKIYTILLDSAAAEHAARTVAMQTATDNGEDLLDELTLDYNKGRQQKITSEILDIVGGSMN